MREHEEILDLLRIPYNYEDIDKAYFPRKIKQYLNASMNGKRGMDLLKQKAKMYKYLLMLSFWLDDKITEIDNDLSKANVELFFPQEKDMVITRSLSNGDRSTFVEEFTTLESKRARQLMLGRPLKGKNIIE